jgi:prepilin-type processing-associated H-X9-DG protein
MYAQDYDGYLPFAYLMKSGGGEISWMETIWPYVNSGNAASITSQGFGAKRSMRCASAPQTMVYSYAVNDNLFGTNNSSTAYCANLEKVESEVALGGDGNTDPSTGIARCHFGFRLTVDAAKGVAPRHNDGLNLVYADSHVKWVTYDDVMDDIRQYTNHRGAWGYRPSDAGYHYR